MQLGLATAAVLASVFCVSVNAGGAPITDELGPHGGLVRRADGLNAEVVVVPQLGVRIYLRNEKNERPNVEQASVYFNLISRGSEVNYYCKPQADYFECRFPHPRHRKPGDVILLQATRKGAHGNFVYKFPLPWGIGI